MLVPMPMPMQKIFFGPPGCGKSFRVRQEARDLEVVTGDDDPEKSPNMIRTVFHTEYGYGDFVAKLLPQTDNGKIEYRIHSGPLIMALARAYADLDQPVLLVIDEINRGNCAQIFGDIFQLLDRDDTGWSEYGINLSDLTKAVLKKELEELGKRFVEQKQELKKFLEENPKLEEIAKKLFDQKQQKLKRLEKILKDFPEKLKTVDSNDYKLHLPSNLSLIGTMNTSDESVYYMDTAFKRRWDFEYMPWYGMKGTPEFQGKTKIYGTETSWNEFLKLLNGFIAAAFKERNVDDKQVGIWFLKAEGLTVSPEDLAKLKKSLEELSGESDLKKWRTHFPKALPYTATPNEKRLLSKSIQNDLKNTHGIVCVGFDFAHLPSELAKALLDYINVPNESKVRALVIAPTAIQNKLMFFLWDNVFSRDRTPLYKLLKDGGENIEPSTFGEFTEKIEAFIKGVIAQKPEVVKTPALEVVKLPVQ